MGSAQQAAEESDQGGRKTSLQKPGAEKRLHAPENDLQEQELLLNGIMRNLPGIVYCGIVHPNGEITFNFVSERITEVLGLPCETEGLLDHFLQRVHPEDRDLLMASIRNAVANYSSWNYEMRFIKAPGETIWIKGLSSPSRRGEDIVYNGIILDVTDQKRAEEALRESETRWQFALEGAGDGVWDWNAQTNEVFFSKQWKAMLGYEEHEIANALEEWDKRLHPEDREQAYADLQNHFIGKTPTYINEHRLRCKDGSYKWILDRGKVVQWTEDGKPLRVIGIHSDITAHKQAEDALEKERAFLRQVIDAVPGFVCVKNLEGGFDLANKALAEAYGATVEELTGRKDADFIKNEEEMQQFLQDDREVILQHKSKYIPEEKITYANGQEHWLSTIKVPLLQANGECAQLLAVATDITERKQAEAALRESEEKFRAFVETSNDWVWAMDIEGRHTYSNGKINDIIGYAPEEILQFEAMDIVHPDDVAATQTLLKECIAEKKGWARFVVRFRHKNGSYRWIESGAVPVLDNQGHLTGFRGTDRDITDRVQAENQRIEMERRLLQSQKLESLGVLAGGIAHDFNNLLMAILGNLDMALMDLPPTGSVRICIEEAIQATNRATILTRQMLAYSGKGRFIMEPLNLKDFLKENAALFHSMAPKTATLEMRLDPAPALIKADPVQLQQIVTNLLLNAAEALGESSGGITLRTGTCACGEDDLGKSRLDEKPSAGEFVFLEVSDTGCGMDEDTLRRMFEPFFSTKFPGRGLGLAAVLGIVRGHNGAIFVNTAVRQGTTVRVLFPAIGHVNSAKDGNSATPSQGPPEPSSRYVLVVDDEEAIRNLCAAFVRRLGYQVITAADGAEALTLFEQHRSGIVCVLLDLTMPRMDGVNTFKRLKRLEPNVKVILCSGYNEHEAMQRFTREGLAGFIQKPYRLKALTEKLQHILREAPPPP